MTYLHSSTNESGAQDAAPHRTNGQTLPIAWAEYLSQFDWKSFVTLTFGDELKDITQAGAWSRFRSLWQIMNRDLHGKRYVSYVGHGYCGYALSFERTTKGVWHMHVLFDDRIHYDLVHRVWNKIAGWAWIEKAVPEHAKYLCKYVTKGGEIKLYMPEKRKEPAFKPLWYLGL